MQNGNLRSDIFITPKTLQRCLDAMVHASQTGVPAVFYGLALVDEYCSDPDMPPLPETSTFPIFGALSDLIRAEYLFRLRANNLRTDIDAGTRESGLERISESSRVGSEDMIGWSFLYYHYVRVDLGIMADSFARAVGVVPRTVRRYRRRAVAELCEVLIDAERKACKASRLRRIEGVLIYDNSRFIGRTTEISRFCQLIVANPCAKVIVTGEVGIGKTGFVSRALKQCLQEQQDDAFDVVIWCDGHEDNTSIVEEVKESCAARLSSRLSIADWQLLVRIAVVIDNISVSTTSTKEIDELFQWLAHCLVVIIADRPVGSSDVDSFCIVTELSKAEARELIRTHLLDVVGVGETIVEHEIDEIYVITKGNPGLIGHVSIMRGLEMQMATTLDMGDFTARPDLVYRISKLPQLLIACLCLLPDASFHMVTMLAVFEPDITYEHIHLLWSLNLIEKVGTFGKELRVPQLVKECAARVYKETEVTDAFVTLFQKLAKGFLIEAEFCEACLRQMIASSVIEMQRQVESYLLKESTHSEHALSNPLIWIRIFEISKSEVDFSLAAHLKHLRQLRRAGRWHSTIVAANDLAKVFRAQAMFLEEAMIRLERSRAFRLLGNYQLAMKDLRFIEFIARREDDISLLDDILIEKVRIALDRGRAHQSIDLMTRISGEVRENSHVQMMFAEASLLIGNIEQSQQTCEDLLATIDMSGEIGGRVYGLLGNIALQRGNLEDAHMYTILAIRTFYESFQPLLLSRAWSNLASILAAADRLDEAMTLILRAIEIQERLGDRIGLMVTKRNLELIQPSGITL